jgi:hypothetical protein
MSADGLLLALVFALCAVGALAGFAVPDRRNPALLAWIGSLAALWRSFPRRALDDLPAGDIEHFD